MRRLRLAFSVLLTLAVLLGGGLSLWITNPSRAFYEPVAANLERSDDGRWMASVTRTLPRGDVDIRWGVTVWVRRGESSYVCQEPLGRAIPYLESSGTTVIYEMPASVARCLDQAPPISVTWTRQVMWLGWVPLIPVTTTITMDPQINETESDG